MKIDLKMMCDLWPSELKEKRVSFDDHDFVVNRKSGIMFGNRTAPKVISCPLLKNDGLNVLLHPETFWEGRG